MAIARRPARCTRYWEAQFLGTTDATGDEPGLADAVHAGLGRRFHRSLAYSRVDLLAGVDREPLVLEVELIDPYLSLSLRPGAVNERAVRLDRLLDERPQSALDQQIRRAYELPNGVRRTDSR